MANNDDNWVQIFDIPDTSQHKKGFTIYKVISMLYPKNCPDSITKVTVWKRYNDFKKFHREMKQYFKSLQSKGFPTLPSISYFHRFDEDVIQQRRAGILQFLQFISLNRLLYTSDICFKFFKTSYTPCDTLDSNIQLIRAELNLPVETEYHLVRSTSDDDHTLSDTDSLSTLSSFQVIDLPDPLNFSTYSSKPAKPSVLKNPSKSSHDSGSLCNVSLEPSVIEEPVYPTPPHTPISNNTDAFTCYIREASFHIEKAIDYEASTSYEESFNEYKAGIDILLRNVKAEKNIDRKNMVRHKVEKYLLRAEKIYNLHLSTDSKTVQNYLKHKDLQDKNEMTNHSELDLYNYKVIRIIGSGMLVLHTGSQKLFYVKVIYKTSKFCNDKLLLPGHVPYMVKLYNYYNCENAIFLVLEYVSCTSLDEYIRKVNSEEIFNCSFSSNATAFNTTNGNEEEESSDSEHSYSDLIYDYKLNRCKNSDSIHTVESAGSENIIETVSDAADECDLREHILQEESGDNQPNNISLSKNLNTLKCDSKDFEMEANTSHDIRPALSRKSSERSEWSWFDDVQINENCFLSMNDITKWAAQLLLSLERLHLLGIICGRLKMKNLLINESGDLVLTYMCNVQDRNNFVLNSNEDGTVAPEMQGFQPITFAADWWSYGAVIYEMLVGVPLGMLYPDRFNTYTTLRFPKHVSVEGRSLLRQLLVYEPRDRLGSGVNGSEDIKTHPFFNSISWDVLIGKEKSTQ